MKTFLFVRHGQSTANLAKEIAVEDTPLTDEGKTQAKLTADKLRGQEINTILCSPLLRARQTAEIIANELGISSPIQALNELAERDLGELKGKPKSYESEKFYTLDTEHGMESREAIINRMQRCLSKIIELTKSGKLVLVVGHAVSGYYLIEVAQGRMKPDQLEPPEEILNAAVVEVSIGKNWGEL